MLNGMALQCSRSHDQDVQGLKVVSRHQPGFAAVAGGGDYRRHRVSGWLHR
jgi:hypothetical protein